MSETHCGSMRYHGPHDDCPGTSLSAAWEAKDRSAATKRRITAWVCVECDYWRQELSTGVHAAPNPEDPNGRMLTHQLRRAEFEEVETDA